MYECFAYMYVYALCNVTLCLWGPEEESSGTGVTGAVSHHVGVGD